MEKITGSEALLRALIAEGVDTIFGYPGGAVIPVYDCLYDYKQSRTAYRFRRFAFRRSNSFIWLLFLDFTFISGFESFVVFVLDWRRRIGCVAA